MNEKLEKLRDIINEVIDDNSVEISENTMVKDLEDWDSVAMVQIVLGVENAFGVKFTTEEVANIHGVADLLKKIK